MGRSGVKPRANPASQQSAWGDEQPRGGFVAQAAPPTISGRWLLGALGICVAAAAVCYWGAMCLLFWQGSWQLLYHPASAVTRTPASAGLAFDSIPFAADETGQPRLTGWWIPAAPGASYAQLTILFLHGQNGNLGGAVDTLAALHAVGANVFAIDYRGFGQSRFAHPSEAHWREDAESAILYLTGTRHIGAGSIVPDGDELGANLALEVAAAHPELAGVILRDPIADPASAIFNDPRARMVPARMLVRDRYDLNAAASALRIPLLWASHETQKDAGRSALAGEAYTKVESRKMLVYLYEATGVKQWEESVSRWLADLPAR